MERINVTKTFLPPIQEYENYLADIWQSGQLTNQGPLLLDFEKKISDYLGVPNFHLVGNGTLALQVALKSLDIDGGEVITTPFSYVASTSAILWERCRPVFVDIDPKTLCIDPNKIEVAVTKRTKAILAVHVFGNPCAIEQIESIARRHNLKVIYDGAHAFGTIYKGRALLSYGDVSTCSFHSTKLFHTIEGGCIITPDKIISEKVELIKRFGHNGDDHFTLGINAKASEFQAAMGLCNLKYIDEIISQRKEASEYYNQLLGERFERPATPLKTDYNYAYYPIILKNESELLTTIQLLNNEDIHPRRYFYPSLNKLPYIKEVASCPVSESIASRIVCLPLYAGISTDAIKKICRVLGS